MRKAVENRWWVVFGCFVALMVNNGVVSNFTFSVFLKPITEELGWGRATITSAMFLAGVVAAFVTPVVGKLMDVYGVQRVTLPGLILYALLFASFSLLQPSLLMLYAIAGTAAIAGHVQTPMGYSKVISSRFEDHRGIALGIAVSGVGRSSSRRSRNSSSRISAGGLPMSVSASPSSSSRFRWSICSSASRAA
jgi:predicted MFS family arabinose efflux permease